MEEMRQVCGRPYGIGSLSEDSARAGGTAAATPPSRGLSARQSRQSSSAAPVELVMLLGSSAHRKREPPHTDGDCDSRRRCWPPKQGALDFIALTLPSFDGRLTLRLERAQESGASCWLGSRAWLDLRSNAYT